MARQAKNKETIESVTSVTDVQGPVEPKSVVTTLITVEGAPAHPMVGVVDKASQEFKAVGFARVDAALGGWVSYTVTFKGTEIINIEVSEPNLRAISEDEAKANFVHSLMDQE